MPTRRPLLALLVSLLAGPFVVRAVEPSPTEAARAMVEAERNFYETGQEKGTRAAFLAFLADDGVVFRPGPVNGKEVWGARAETGLDLIWEPTFATMARSADFGYTTGPAKWRATKKEEAFAGHGQFVSIWKKQKDGSWRVALDLGIETPPPIGKPEPTRIAIATGPTFQTNPLVAPKNLKSAQKKFADAAKTDSKAATLAIASKDIRVYRNGHFPALGSDAASELLSAQAGKMSLEPMGGDLSHSADLAYAYGKYSLARAEGDEKGHYFQIWQTDRTGEWNLVLDWQQALPKEEPAE
jgi:ketosteroid isomerase-like protein